MLSSGTILDNRYQITQYLAGGGFGDTYLAQDLKLPGNPYCVVKHLKPKDPDPHVLIIARRLFETEAQILYKLGKHDQIPQLFAHFEEKGEFYLVQEFVKGPDLTKEIITGKKLSESYVITLLQNILEILAFAHQQNVIHRDIKPANLMRRQEDGKIVLIDFGAVKEIGTLIVNAQGQTSLTIAVGTPGYMPSEQAKGKPRLCSDVYAVGMIGIQALTGKTPDTLPEDPNTGEVVWRNQAQISNDLANFLDKMVRDHFSRRYQNANEALQALLSLSPQLSGSNAATIPVTPKRNPSPSANIPSPNTTRRTFLELAGFAGGGFIIAVLSQTFWNKSTPSANNPSPSRSLNQTPSPSLSPEDPPPQPSPTSPLKSPSKSPSNSLKTFQFQTVTVNSTGEITNRRQEEAEFFTENLPGGITIDMIAIPGGSFVMGSPSTEKGRYDTEEGPQHKVTVAPFFMGKYEVTQAVWRAVAGLPKVNIDLNPNPSRFKGDDLPVEQVSWYEAVEACARLSRLTGRDYRLPSEAEWEYACRAGTTTPFYFGETITPDLVNYDGNYSYGAAPKGKYREKTVDVGSFPPNAFGLYDMHGNVWEWCADPWHGNYNGAPTDGSVWDEKNNDNRYQKSADLLVMSRNDDRSRLLRGGSWTYDPPLCRSAIRFNDASDTRNNINGFRFVCVWLRGQNST
jgi:formylglycine-generating enzyme required for sulfatase activity